MKKFLTFLLTLLVSIFVFNNNVKANYDYTTDTPLIKGCFGSDCAYIYHNKIDNQLLFHRSIDGSQNNKTISLDEYPYFYCYYSVNLYCNMSTEPLFATKNSSGSYNGTYIPSGVKMYSVGFRASYNESWYTPSTLTGPKTAGNSLLYPRTPYKANYNIYYQDSTDIHITKNYDTTPTINITKERENELTLNNGGSVVLNKEMKISFSNFDTSKYKYLYSYDIENWKEITENDYEFLVNKNCTIFVQITDLEDNYITSSSYTITGIIENIIDYSIEDGTEKGKKLTIYYYNFETTDYHIVSNFQTGSEKKYDSELMGTIIYDNLNLDNTYSINSYDKDNNLLKRKTIDIQVEDAKLNNKRYITHTIFKERKSIFFSYFNIKKNDKCFYKISSEEEIEVNCDKSYEINLNKNGYIDLYIKNNEEIVLKRGVNVNFINNLPQFKFDSYYKDSESKQVLKIIVENLQSNDKIYYSYDKELWNELETKRINYLDFYVSKEVYFKVVRDETIVSEAYFDLVYKAYENSSDNNNLEKYDGLKGLLEYFKDITRNVTNAPFEIGKSAYELLRQSKFGLYILLIIVSSIIILILKSIKR